MKRLAYYLIPVLLITIITQITTANAGYVGSYRPKEKLISMFKDLCDANPEYASYEVIGKSYEGRDIWLFKLGNPEGGKVMWDGCLHGSEDQGSEIIYLFAEWLLESGDERAERILQRNYILFVPLINVDSYTRQNRDFEDCQYGVDLNRNFKTGWQAKAPNDYDYPGPYAVSEPETEVMRNLFEAYRPHFYVNTHMGGGPWLGWYSRNNRTFVNQVLDRINELSVDMEVSPYTTNSVGSRGYAIGDAYSFGACAWLIETCSSGGHVAYPYEDVVNIYFPKCLPILIAMCEACETETIEPSASVSIAASGLISYEGSS